MPYLTMQEARALLAESGVRVTRQRVQQIVDALPDAARTLRERVITERLVDADALRQWIEERQSK